VAEFVRRAALAPATASLVWAAAGRWTAAWAGIGVLQALVSVATVLATRPLVDAIARAEARTALVFAGLIGAALVAGEALRAASGYVRAQVSERVSDHVMELVHRKSVELDLAFYDSPEFFDRMHRARMEATYRPVAMIESVGNALQDGITLVAMFGVLLTFGVWVPLALLVSTAPAFWVVLRYAVRQHEFRLRTTADERRTWYYGWLLTDRETAAEVRLFGLGGHFREKYSALRARLREERFGLERENAIAELTAGGIALSVTGASLGWMLWRSVNGLASLGSLAMFYQAFQQGLRLMRSLLDNVGQLYYNSLFLGNLFEFLALEKTVVDCAEPARAPVLLREGIRFEGVTFHYPGSEAPVLRNFNLVIPAGRLAAFVGPNGAGKSTFIKLLCRFYDPEEGRITFDGVDLRSFAQDELRSRIAVLLQEPVRYNATCSENIGLGDVGARAGEREVRAAAEAAGAAEIVEALPGGYANLLGKSFLEGAELSSGEWQRIALARAFFRRAPVILLDEPTSAMDPWAESDWLARLRVLAEGRTAVLITHRFTTAMRADVIFVMAGGEVVESGSHAELAARGGLYAQSWREQTEQGVVAA
jgi:ATP-binding cassette subfamily B protein